MPSSSSSQPAEYLRRYTDLPALLYMLRRKKLSLLSPDSWDDKNDSHFIELYRERRALPTVLALCFTEKGETYHHWRVFSSGSGGICIKFHRVALLEHLSKFKGVRFGVAKYAMMDRLRNQPPALDDLPFLKRYAFRDEDEFRVIYEGMKTKRETNGLPAAVLLYRQNIYQSLGSRTIGNRDHRNNQRHTRLRTTSGWAVFTDQQQGMEANWCQCGITHHSTGTERKAAQSGEFRR